jgi:hypothetical protein
MPIKIELVASAITAATLSQTWSDLCNSASKVFTRNGIKGAQIEFLLVILPECRDFDGMEVIVWVRFTFDFLGLFGDTACDALQRKSKSFFNSLGVVYQLCLPKTVRITTNRHLKKFARPIKFKASLPLL